jgi:hypothetical protein
MKKAIALTALAVSMGSASAATWIIGDDDGYGAGIANGANHPPFVPTYDGRSAAEVAATNGAEFTDTYSTAHPGYSPQAGTVATFTFTNLGTGWTEGNMIFDMADFQATTFGAVAVTFNGVVQNWAFDDGYPITKIRAFSLEQAVLDQINLTGQLVVSIDRNGIGDFYGFDYAGLSNDITVIEIPPAIPEPSTYALMASGLGLMAFIARRRQRKQSSEH